MTEPRARAREGDEKTVLALLSQEAAVPLSRDCEVQDRRPTSQSILPRISVREEALRFLDAVSAPLTPREIERALREHGISKARRTILAGALAHLNIIAVKPKDQA